VRRKDTAGSVPATTATERPAPMTPNISEFTRPEFATEISLVESDLLVFLRTGQLPVWLYETDEGRQLAAEGETTQKERDLERAYWVAAHHAQAARLRQFIDALPTMTGMSVMVPIK
jgi:hypothetical protein